MPTKVEEIRRPVSLTKSAVYTELVTRSVLTPSLLLDVANCLSGTPLFSLWLDSLVELVLSTIPTTSITIFLELSSK
jgi:hypothetical protein